MKKTLPIVMVAASLLLAPAPPDAAACGDKFLVIGRTARRIEKARHPASILLLLQSHPGLAAAARTMKLEATLKQAGHTVETMTATTPLADFLSTRQYDVILTGLDAAPAAVRDSLAAPSHPLVIPVAVRVKGARPSAEESPYGLVIDAPSRSLAYLAALDAAIGRRRAVVAR
jgi:hypothetical protein